MSSLRPPLDSAPARNMIVFLGLYGAPAQKIACPMGTSVVDVWSKTVPKGKGPI